MVLKSLLLRKWSFSISEATTPLIQSRAFRSEAALTALQKASEEKNPNLVLYNYPSFSGAFAALFARLYHSLLDLPCLILPFSSIEPLRVEDLKVEGLETCYLVDFVGPKGFAVELSRSVGRVIAFDHRNSTLSKIPAVEDCPENLTFHVNVNKSSARAVFDYFSSKLVEAKSINGEVVSLVKSEDMDRLMKVLEYIEDGDLRRWSLPDIRSFNIGISEERRKINCVTNRYMFDQGIRADGNTDLSNEIGNELSVRSAAAGLRPIGAVVYMQGKNLKMSLRSTDTNTDTSEVAKAYGGGGTSSSSSFIIRMDEYNHWISPS